MKKTFDTLKRYNHLMWEISAVYHDAAVKLGLSDSAMDILYTVALEGGSYPLSDICKLSGLSKQTVNSALRKLESENVVYSKAQNGRKKLICLTESGKKLAERTVSHIIEIENKIFSSWHPEVLTAYISNTQRYLDEFRYEIDNLEITMEEKK